MSAKLVSKSMVNFYKILVITLFLFLQFDGNAAIPPADSSQTAFTRQVMHQILSLPVKDIESGIGRKLRWSEKIAIKAYQKLPERTQEQILADKRVNNQALLAFIFFVASVLIFPLLLFASIPISASALQNHKRNNGTLTPGNYTLAKVAFWGSIALLALYLLVIALVIILVTRAIR